MKDETYFNLVGVIMALAVVIGFGVAAFTGVLGSNGPSGSASPPAQTSYVNLTIELNNTTGAPQYLPANFTVPTGTVVVTIVDGDVAGSWPGCACQVTGTVGGTETVNGSAVSSVNSSNVAHTFSIPSLGLNVLSPGGSTVQFTMYVTTSGDYTWWCMAPCGSDGYSGFPMDVPGYMTGTMSVV
jgi:hypothetical protein